MLGSVNTYLILRADLWTAQMAAIWGAGSLNGLDWSEVARWSRSSLARWSSLCVWSRRQMRLDGARRRRGRARSASGSSAIRLALVVLGVSLIAVVTAVAGPIPSSPSPRRSSHDV